MKRATSLLLLFCACATTRFEARDPAYEPRRSTKDPLFFAPRDVPVGAKTIGRLEVFHANLTSKEAIFRAALREGREQGCTWLVHENPKGNAAVQTEGVELSFSAGVLGPPQAEGENRAVFRCLGP